MIFEGKSHLNGEKRDGTTKSNTAPDSSVVMFQGYGFDSGLSLIIFHIPLHAVKAHRTEKISKLADKKCKSRLSS